MKSKKNMYVFKEVFQYQQTVKNLIGFEGGASLISEIIGCYE
jgi:hypothetical protein